MKSAKILYVQHGDWVRITGWENIKTIDELIEHFMSILGERIARKMLTRYLMGSRIGLSSTEYSYQCGEGSICIKRHTRDGIKMEFVRAGDIIRRQEFEELVKNLRSAGDRLQILFVSFSENVQTREI